MKIYTKTGDDGTTGLFGGDRTRKDDARLECYGTIDETNAAIGLAAAVASTALQSHLRDVQRDLLTIGAHLATPIESPSAAELPPLDDSIVSRLEMQIDAADAKLPRLRQFILPGGSEPAARLHFARTVCRRAERLLVAFAQDRPVPAVMLTYMNRLSDWLFVMARLANHDVHVADVPWEGAR